MNNPAIRVKHIDDFKFSYNAYITVKQALTIFKCECSCATYAQPTLFVHYVQIHCECIKGYSELSKVDATFVVDGAKEHVCVCVVLIDPAFILLFNHPVCNYVQGDIGRIILAGVTKCRFPRTSPVSCVV